MLRDRHVTRPINECLAPHALLNKRSFGRAGDAIPARPNPAPDYEPGIRFGDDLYVTATTAASTALPNPRIAAICASEKLTPNATNSPRPAFTSEITNAFVAFVI